ncbi:TrkA family potassium uptake protein [Brevibacterium sp. UMB1308A]|uniref:potassium channel family protein n=1 Tax=Brevibacterium sp. UMB1308A TaxID=3050608 RepID=UPI00254C6EFF|nr:TrkA family potassium uptake protein [Brevibacterium sp. UMB1308A]MDK8346407.1 TrkA family potassium uptake protein [Brevibacterium sp. UMB1308B]MDK8713342.1 TrkA family potassium uptake protein [Brevibacterium sp. UMB1308A]
MKVVIAGAGSVGRSVARELIDKGHTIVMIDNDKQAIRRDLVPDARWVHTDACELDGLADAQLEDSDVVVAATGDDKTNLVLSLLAKTEFGVPRTVGRVNNPRNEWLFDSNWGVDVAVSTPRLMTALVEEAVEVGNLVQLLTLQQAGTTLMEMTLHEASEVLGKRVGDIELPQDTVLVAVVRSGRAFAPQQDDTLVDGDELFFLADASVKPRLRELFS